MKKLPILTALFGCSSSSSLNGVGAFSPNTQLSEEITDAGPDLMPSLGIDMLDIASGPVNCTEALDGSIQFLGQFLGITLFKADGTLVTSGTYRIVDPSTPVYPDGGNLANLTLASNDLDAGFNENGVGVSGTVTLSEKSPMTSGSFSATILLFVDGGGGNLTGNFNATLCATP
jgi:hypothetical protein